MNHSDWYSYYTAALLELNPTKLSTRIHEAETAIYLRVQDLAEDRDSSRERELIADALFSLRALRRKIRDDFPSGQVNCLPFHGT
jgi:hypothetical protein